MTEPTPDPQSEFEDQGIPDLRDGQPAVQWAEDPQMEPVPGDEPAGIDRTGTTVDEQVAGESLDERLGEEEPDVAAGTATADELAYGDELRDVDVGADERVPPEEATGESIEPTGRLVQPDEGVREEHREAHGGRRPGADTGGWSPEERAMRTEPER